VENGIFWRCNKFHRSFDIKFYENITEVMLFHMHNMRKREWYGCLRILDTSSRFNFILYHKTVYVVYLMYKKYCKGGDY